MPIPAEIVLLFQMTIMMDWLAELFYLMDWALFNGFQHRQKILFPLQSSFHISCALAMKLLKYTLIARLMSAPGGAHIDLINFAIWVYLPMVSFWIHCLIWIKSKQIMSISLLICHQFLLISVIHNSHSSKLLSCHWGFTVYMIHVTCCSSYLALCCWICL